MKVKMTGRILFTPVAVLLMSLACTGRSFAADAAADDTIIWNVTAALADDDRIDAANLTVDCNAGIVTLSGTVDALAGRNYADQEAKKIKGVLGVVNQISVTPVWRADTDIRDAVQRRILSSYALDWSNVDVACSKGKVTLSGTVHTWNESQQAELLASEVSGVKEVVNNIDVVWEKTRSDAEILDDAVARLARDVYLEGLPITVTVDQGVVTLNGSVGSAYEKGRAGDDMRWLSNVNDVQNNLTAESWEDYGVRKKIPAPSDSQLEDFVKRELADDSRVNADDISVKSEYGTITLTGSVYSHQESKIAERDARNVIGVGWVSNKLFARVDQRADWAVSDDVSFNLDTDAVTEGFDIGVLVNNGVVTLTGTVNTWYEKFHAGDVAARVKGVRDVINQIVQGDYQPAVGTLQHSAAQVAKDVRKALDADAVTTWVSGRINVLVTDGVATLTGDVDTWEQRREAADVAYTTKGVWEVKNKLVVTDYDYSWDDYDYYNCPFCW